jgi:hypothetical protein
MAVRVPAGVATLTRSSSTLINWGVVHELMYIHTFVRNDQRCTPPPNAHVTTPVPYLDRPVVASAPSGTRSTTRWWRSKLEPQQKMLSCKVRLRITGAQDRVLLGRMKAPVFASGTETATPLSTDCTHVCLLEHYLMATSGQRAVTSLGLISAAYIEHVLQELDTSRVLAQQITVAADGLHMRTALREGCDGVCSGVVGGGGVKDCVRVGTNAAPSSRRVADKAASSVWHSTRSSRRRDDRHAPPRV